MAASGVRRAAAPRRARSRGRPRRCAPSGCRGPSRSSGPITVRDPAAAASSARQQRAAGSRGPSEGGVSRPSRNACTHGPHAAAPALASSDLEQVLLVAVHAAVGDEAEQVQRPPLAGRERESAARAPGSAPRRRRASAFADARHVHVDDAAGAERHVADLGVAHLAGRQAHRLARGLDLRHRDTRGARASKNGAWARAVASLGAAVAEAEAVEHDQHTGRVTSRGPLAACRPRRRRAVSARRPEPLEVVVLALLALEHVDDHVVEVDQHPARRPRSPRRRAASRPSCVGALHDRVGDRLHVAVGACPSRSRRRRRTR